MTSTGLTETFSSTKQTLHEAGIDDDFFLDLVATRLLVERVGESKNLDWWDSLVLSKTGKIRLSEMTPKTSVKARINLALKIGRKAESDRIPEDTISLYSLGPQMESRLRAAIDEIEVDGNVSLEALEQLSVQSLEEGWADEIIEQTSSNISGVSDSISLPDPDGTEALLIDESGYTEDEIEPEKWRLLVTLLRGYGQCTSLLRVPYYPLEPLVKSENA
jgi:hypothetical protein